MSEDELHIFLPKAPYFSPFPDRSSPRPIQTWEEPSQGGDLVYRRQLASAPLSITFDRKHAIHRPGVDHMETATPSHRRKWMVREPSRS